MKKAGIIIGVIAIIIIVVAISTCNGVIPGNSVFQIKVSGTEGLEFSGSYMVTTADAKVTSKSVDGFVPEQYSVTGTMVSVVFQKQTEAGFLSVEIIKGDEVIANEYTTAAYGVVSIATD